MAELERSMRTQRRLVGRIRRRQPPRGPGDMARRTRNLDPLRTRSIERNRQMSRRLRPHHPSLKQRLSRLRRRPLHNFTRRRLPASRHHSQRRHHGRLHKSEVASQPKPKRAASARGARRFRKANTATSCTQRRGCGTTKARTPECDDTARCVAALRRDCRIFLPSSPWPRRSTLQAWKSITPNRETRSDLRPPPSIRPRTVWTFGAPQPKGRPGADIGAARRLRSRSVECR